MPLREALTLAVSAFFYPQALEHFGAPAEEVEKAKQMSRHILLKALADMGGFETGVPVTTANPVPKAAVALPDDDDFDDAFN